MDIISDNPSIIFRVDAKKEIALGHLKRCSSLANKLVEKGVDVSFVTLKDGFTKEYIKKFPFKHIILDSEVNSDENYRKTIDVAKQVNSKVIIIDSYEIKTNYRKKLKESGLFVITIDDLNDKDIPSHVIVNGNLNAENMYKNINNVSLVLGIKYLLLDKNFGNLDTNAMQSHDLDNVNNVLITMGGIDHYNLTSKILELLDKMDAHFDITVIIGPYYDNMESIESMSCKMKKTVNLVYSPSSLYSYMCKCSLAFSAGGQTLYELASLGRPTIGITLWENQAGNVTELSKIGAIKGVLYSEKDFSDKLGRICFELIHDKNLRKKMSKIASSTIDGKGTERVSETILRLYSDWIKH